MRIAVLFRTRCSYVVLATQFVNLDCPVYTSGKVPNKRFHIGMKFQALSWVMWRTFVSPSWKHGPPKRRYPTTTLKTSSCEGALYLWEPLLNLRVLCLYKLG
jgi:hypothetical protein